MAPASPRHRERMSEPRSSRAPLFFEVERKHRLMQHLLWIACVVFWYFTVHSFIAQRNLVGWLTLIYACLASLWLIFTYLFKGPFFLAWSSRFFVLVMAGILLFYLCLGGPDNGFALWSYVFPLVTFFLLGKRQGLVMVILFWIVECVLLLASGQALLKTEYTTAFKFRYLVSQALVIMMTYFFEAGRQKSQAKMQQQQSRLKQSESRAQEAIKQLKITQSQLVQSGKLASIGELAAGVAHELNQPLMVIRGNAQLVKRQMSKPDFKLDHMNGFLGTIERNTQRMRFIIDHLRSFSRQSPAKLEPLDINTVVKNAFFLIGEQLRLHDIDVDQDLEDGLPKILGDTNQLEQVILNLLTNARDALEGSAVKARERHRRIIIIATHHICDQNMVEIVCKDSGTGIPSNTLDAIFDPFFTTKAVGKGTGLGLSISYGIVKHHGGQIEVVDTGPKGTTFRVVLPVVTPAANCIEDAPSSMDNLTPISSQ